MGDKVSVAVDGKADLGSDHKEMPEAATITERREGMNAEQVNREIAERVMGWHEADGAWWSADFQFMYQIDPSRWGSMGIGYFDPMYRIEHALMVLDQMAAWDMFKTELNEYGCNVWPKAESDEMFFSGYADTAQEAICLAALEAVIAATT